MSGISASGNMTKKLACIDAQSTLRSEVIFPSAGVPAMSKVMRSPNLSPSVWASPCSTLTAPASFGCQRPALISLWGGRSAACERLNSRSTSRCARSSLKSVGLTGLPLMATSRPRNMGYQSIFVTPASFKVARNASPWSGMTLMTKRFGASAGVAARQLLMRSVRSNTSSTSASRPTARLLICTTA